MSLAVFLLQLQSSALMVHFVRIEIASTILEVNNRGFSRVVANQGENWCGGATYLKMK